LIRLRRLAAVAVPAGIALVLVPIADAASTASPKPSSNLIAVGPGGHRLAADPVLRAGERISVTITGFARSTSVTAVFVNTTIRRRYRADGRGDLHVLVILPAGSAGNHEIVFVGAPRTGVKVATRPTGPSLASGGPSPASGGNVEVVVPLLATFPYRLGPTGPPRRSGHGVEATSTTRPAGASGSGAGGLSRTGVDIAALLALAVAAIAAGLGAVRAGRRHH
jgi:hypothetical protein